VAAVSTGPASVEALADVWSAILALGRTLDDAAWATPTPLPGWTVKDVVSHISGTELAFMGRPDPRPERPIDHPWIRNDFARHVEVAVERRRPWPPAEVLAEFEAVTSERLAGLRALDEAGFAAETITPVGPGTVERLLHFRVFDSWVHEHDIRAALGLPWRFESPAFGRTWEMTVGGWPRQVVKAAGAPDGTVVVVRLDGDGLTRTVAVVVEGGRGRLVEEAEAEGLRPTVSLTATAPVLLQVAWGRLDPATPAVAVEGDADLARRVLATLNFVP
jgi:uncharacterized protein (TIGR03083 family)